jgi:hypothetical protein
MHGKPYNDNYEGLELKKNEETCFNFVTLIYFEHAFDP